MKTPISSMALVLIGSLIGSLGAVCLKWGALDLRRNWRSFLFNWKLAAGIAAYLLSSVFFVMGVKKGQLSVLYPLVSLGYICTLFWSRLFFNEKLTAAKFLGLGLILAGIVFLMGLGNQPAPPCPVR